MSFPIPLAIPVNAVEEMRIEDMVDIALANEDKFEIPVNAAAFVCKFPRAFARDVIFLSESPIVVLTFSVKFSTVTLCHSLAFVSCVGAPLDLVKLIS